MSRFVWPLIAGIRYFYPKLVVQWLVASIVAGVAAYMTSGNALAPFEAWFIVDYLLIQWLFGIYNRRKEHA
jgi:hypothetical protein